MTSRSAWAASRTWTRRYASRRARTRYILVQESVYGWAARRSKVNEVPPRHSAAANVHRSLTPTWDTDRVDALLLAADSGRLVELVMPSLPFEVDTVKEDTAGRNSRKRTSIDDEDAVLDSTQYLTVRISQCKPELFVVVGLSLGESSSDPVRPARHVFQMPLAPQESNQFSFCS